MSYISFDYKKIEVTDLKSVEKSYDQGFVFTRSEVGLMEEVRSLRINLAKFELSSENRRILRKFECELHSLPVPYPDYSWEIHKLGKDFYDTKFGKGVFSANKIKELFTIGVNFNNILSYKTNSDNSHLKNLELEKDLPKGFCITYLIPNTLIHYAYPFYDSQLLNSNFGMFMMTKAVQWAKEGSLNYIYLGSVHNKSALYKLQFSGMEWWDERERKWSEDFYELKNRV